MLQEFRVDSRSEYINFLHSAIHYRFKFILGAPPPDKWKELQIYDDIFFNLHWEYTNSNHERLHDLLLRSYSSCLDGGDEFTVCHVGEDQGRPALVELDSAAGRIAVAALTKG